MRRTLFAAAAASLLAVAACGQPAQTDADAGDAAGAPAGQIAGIGGMPSFFQGAFRLEANTYADGQMRPIVMIRDGGKMRMEFTDPEAGAAAVIFKDDEYIMIGNMMGRPMALRISAAQVPTTPDQEWGTVREEGATRVGPCSKIGESGTEWSHTDAETGQTGSACVTNDGIILEAKEGDQVVWEATRVTRGAQSADLFELPEGVEVVDLGALQQGLEAQMRQMAPR